MKNQIEVRDTVTHVAQKEVDHVMVSNNITIDNYKYISYNINPVILRGTIFDINSLWNEKAKVREEFSINSETETITIPNFYVKINGVFDDKIKQKELEDKLVRDAVVFRDFQVKQNILNSLHGYIHENFIEYIQKYGVNEKTLRRICKEAQEECSEFANRLNIFDNLNSYIYNHLIKKIIYFYDDCMAASMFHADSFDSTTNKKKANDELILSLILEVIFLPEKMVKLLNSWDFSSHVPKVVIYDEHISKHGNTLDYLLTNFYNYLGIDVAIICPTAATSIESFDLQMNKDYLSTVILDSFKAPKKRTYEERKEIIFYSKIAGGVLAGIICIVLLISMIAPIVKEKQEIALQKRIAHVEQLINDIGVVTLDSFDEITAANDAFQDLDKDERQYVKNSTSLVSAQNKYTELQKQQEYIKNANAVIEKIAKLTNITMDDYSTVMAVKLDYDSLKAEEKVLVTNYTLLLEALDKLSYASDNQNANEVIQLIDSLGVITLDSYSNLASVYNKYESLNDDDKKYVTNDVVLLEAINNYYDLLKASLDTEEKVINKVQSIINTVKTLNSLTPMQEKDVIFACELYENMSFEQQEKITNADVFDFLSPVGEDSTFEALQDTIFSIYGNILPILGMLLVIGMMMNFLSRAMGRDRY